MFNRVHTSIFKISTSYLNFYSIPHLGKRSKLPLINDVSRYFEPRILESEVQIWGYANFSIIDWVGLNDYYMHALQNVNEGLQTTKVDITSGLRKGRRSFLQAGVDSNGICVGHKSE